MEQRGSGQLKVCPSFKLEGAGHCPWRAGRHLKPSHLHSKDLLDHPAKEDGSDPAEREQAQAMVKGIMPGGLAEPFAVARAGSSALALPAGVPPSRAQGASSSAASGGARGSAAVSSAGGKGAGSGAAHSSAVRASAVPVGVRLAAISSRGSAGGVGVRSCRGIDVPVAHCWCHRPSSNRRTGHGR